MARIDKYNPYVGNFRAPLAADFLTANLNKVIGVGLDANGKVVLGVGANGKIAGVIVLTKVMSAGGVVDVMRHGEIVELTTFSAGQSLTVLTTDGTLGSTAADATHIAVGFTVEATRLIVDVSAL